MLVKKDSHLLKLCKYIVFQSCPRSPLQPPGNVDLEKVITRRQQATAGKRYVEFVDKIVQEDKKHRNDLIITAHLEFGYTLKHIADHLGLHYSTVMKIVSLDT